MKTIQKLEIAAGVATFVSTLIYFGVYILSLAKFYYERDDIRELFFSLIGGVILLVLPGVLAGLGAYFWASKATRLGFAAVVLGGTITALYFGAYLFTGAAFYYHGFIVGLLVVAPLVFAMLAIVFALGCRKLFSLPK